MKIIDEILSISNSSAFNFSRQLAKCEGIAGGISTGAVIAAAIEVHEHIKYERQSERYCNSIIC